MLVDLAPAQPLVALAVRSRVGFVQDPPDWLCFGASMTNQLTVVRTFAHPSQAVFDAWISSDTLVAPVTEVEMDAVPGGRVRVSTGGGPESDLVGTFLVADEPSRLVYTWSWGGTPEETIVDVSFHAVGGHTVVEVNHRGFLDEASRDTHLSGWIIYFDGVEAHL